MRRLSCLVLLGACERQDPNPAPPLVVDTGADCATAAPVLVSLTVENGGLESVEGTERATAALSAEVNDEVDQDLDRLSADFWWDDVIDGAVDTTLKPNLAGDVRLIEDNPCRVRRASYGVGVVIGTERGWEPDREYEVAVIAYDAHGAATEVGFASGWAPNLDGSDGGP